MIRRIGAVIAACSLILIVAAPALAGGWAEIVPDAASLDPAEPPIERQDVTIGFTVLQHGETPAPWERPTVRFTDTETGMRFEATATSTGPDGHFALTTQLPSAGFWTWTVILGDLMNDPTAYALVVHTDDGQAPTLDPTLVMTAIEAARRGAVGEANGVMFEQLERINASIGEQRQISREQAAQLAALEAAAEAGAQPTTEGGLPIAAVVTISVLAGSVAGFLMAWLAGRPTTRPIEVAPITPATREADPA